MPAPTAHHLSNGLIAVRRENGDTTLLTQAEAAAVAALLSPVGIANTAARSHLAAHHALGTAAVLGQPHPPIK